MQKMNPIISSDNLNDGLIKFFMSSGLRPLDFKDGDNDHAIQNIITGEFHRKVKQPVSGITIKLQ